MSEVKRYTACIDGIPVGRQVVLAEDYDALQQRLTAAEQRVERFEALMLESNELLYVIQDGLGAHLSSAVDEVRGKVFTALKPAESISHEIPGTSGMRLNMLANQGE